MSVPKTYENRTRTKKSTEIVREQKNVRKSYEYYKTNGNRTRSKNELKSYAYLNRTVIVRVL